MALEPDPPSGDPPRPGRLFALLVEDQAATRARLAAILDEAFPGIAIATAGSLKEANARLDAAPPARDAATLALIDIGLPDGSGITFVRRLAQERPAILPVIATIYDDDAHLFEAIAAGAHGYVLKDEESALLAGYLRRIERGEPPLSPSIAHRILAHFRAPLSASPAKDEAGLTGREGETLSLLAKGLTVAEAAARLGLKPQTVASYVKVIYQKLNVSTRAAATREAMRRGLA